MGNMPDQNQEQKPHQMNARYIILGMTIIFMLFAGAAGLSFSEQRRYFENKIDTINTDLVEIKEALQVPTQEDLVPEEKVEEVAAKTEKNTAATDAITNTVQKTAFSSFMPAVFNPSGAFSPVEKSEIQKKIIEPYRTYHYYMPSELGSVPVSMMIEKIGPEKVSVHGYAYSATVVWTTGTEGWLFGKNGIVDYWRPECMGECPYSDEFKEKYPYLVQSE